MTGQEIEEPTFQLAEDFYPDDKQHLDDKDDSDKITFVMEEEDVAQLLPGSLRSMLDLDEPEEIARETDWENDGDHFKFIPWLRQQLENLPQHSGQTTVGCERVIAALDRLNRELSKAIQTDTKSCIDETAAEEMRDYIYEAKDMLEDAKSKLIGKKTKKKKSSFRIGKEVVARINDGRDIQYFISIGNDLEETLLKVSVLEPTDAQVALFLEDEVLTKEAGAGVTLVEDPFLHSITRLLINSHIKNGKDMEKVYAHFKDKYDFTAREELSIHELLYQKGFNLIKDFGRVGEGKVRPSEGKGIEHDTEYYA